MAATHWLFFLPQLAGTASRVRVWRRLQRAGAHSLKGAVWVLPDVPSAAKTLGWLRHELADEGVGGLIVRTTLVAGLTDAELEREFREAASARWDALLADLEQATPRRLRALRRRFEEAAAADFFQAAQAGRASRLLRRLEALSGPSRKGGESASYLGRTWVTRRDIHVDRMASAWLIRRFIDPRARLRFVDLTRYQHRDGELRFDLQGAEFTHQGPRCTFEVLQHRFRPRDAALRFLGELVHDLDFEDGRFARPETAGFGSQMRAIASGHPGDAARLERATALLDDLYAHRSRKVVQLRRNP